MNATKKEKIYMSKVVAIGCILDNCRMPAEVHHIRAGVGMGQRNSNFNILPLCPAHHRTGGFGVAIHAGQKTWEKKYGTELDLLNKVKLFIDITV